LKELPDPEPFRNVPLSNALKLLIICPVEIGLLLSMFSLAFGLLKKVYIILGYPSNLVVCFGAVVYIVISFALAWKPARHIYHIDKKSQ
jgi:hypothetical protein